MNTPPLIHRLNNFLHRALCVAALGALLMTAPTAYASPELVSSQSSRWSELVGRPIRTVTVVVTEIFDEPDAESIYRSLNSVKINTRTAVVKRELLVHEGDAFDPFMVAESERALRALGYLRSVRTEVNPTPDGGVAIVVIAQDAWTFIPSLSYSTGTGRGSKSAGLAESNVMGLGKRMELLFEQSENRNSIEAVYDDPRVMLSEIRALTGFFHRDDGDRVVLLVGDPFRTLTEEHAWLLNVDHSDLVGRLFENGDERYIFRQERADYSARFTQAFGSPLSLLRRVSLGYNYQEDNFTQADLKDYKDLDLDPAVVSNDPALLPFNRRFTGPVITYESIRADFISGQFIDRFSRVQDINLGAQHSAGLFLAPSTLGSRQSAGLFNGNLSDGGRIGSSGFVRAEIGVSGRVRSGDVENSLARAELKFYQVFEPLFVNELFLGRHTLAATIFADYGYELDRDRELLLGSDNLLRGYAAKTFVGDKRIGVSIEDRIHFVDDAFRILSLGGAVFADAGGVTRSAFGSILQNDLYADVGVGLRVAFPRSSGGKVLRIDVAFPLRDGPDGSGAFEPRIVLSGGQIFGSDLRSESFGPERSNIEVGVDR